MSLVISVTKLVCSDVPLNQLLFWWPHQNPPQPHIKSKAPCLVTIFRPAKSTCSVIHRSAANHWGWCFLKCTYLGEVKNYFALSAARENTGVTCTTHWCVLIYRGSYTLRLPVWGPDGWMVLNMPHEPLIGCCWHCLLRSAVSKPNRPFRVSWFLLPVTT